MPRLAEIGSAADVRDGVDESAIEEAEAIGSERGIGADAVSAIAVEQHRRLPVLDQALLIDQRDRDLHAVRRGRVDALGLILGGIVAAEHFLLLFQLALTGVHVVIENRVRRDQ